MRSMTGEEWMVASQLYAFLGNSLLSPMSRTESVGLDPAFWRELGGLLDGALADSAESLASWAERASADAARSETVQRVSVEFTKLFVGPPKPAAAPWESANGPVDSHVGFGEATFAMRERLARPRPGAVQREQPVRGPCGHRVAVPVRALPPGIGRALRRRRLRCGRAGCGGDRVVIREHPLVWVPRLREKVAGVAARRAISFACSMLCWRC